MLRLVIALQSATVAWSDRAVAWFASRLVTPTRGAGAGLGDRAQSTAEYALVLLGAAAIALALAAWATKTDKIGKLLDGVLSRIMSHLS